jgi:muramoyltetrapeptide carboxypeptidase
MENFSLFLHRLKTEAVSAKPPIIVPPYLKKGDRIGITCPAGYLNVANVKTCVQTLQAWGFEVVVGKTVGGKSNTYFSGTDEERLHEFQAMLDNPEINAILCGRGGYGSSRLLDKLRFNRFKKTPKWIIGFSDITALHGHLLSKLNTSSIHGPMASAFIYGKKDPTYIQSLRGCLTGRKIRYSHAAHPMNRLGKSSAPLVGGNLSLFCHLLGTPSEIDTRNKILFIEDIGEQHYAIDRMLVQCKRSGKLKHLAGLIVGGFSDMKNTERPFGKTLEEIILDAVVEYDYPVCFGFPISHDPANLAVKLGLTYTLSVSNTLVTLNEQSAQS